MARRFNRYAPLPRVNPIRAAAARLTMAEALASLFVGIEQDDPADSIEGGITPAEAILEGEFTRALQPALQSLYRAPLADIAEAIDLPARKLPPWFLSWYTEHPAHAAALAAILTTYARRSFNLGGQMALGELGITGETFSLTDPTILGQIDDLISALAEPDGSMSLVRTTANELARQTAAQREAGATTPADLLPVLSAYGIARSVIRTSAIVMTEGVRFNRWGMAAAFVGNGVKTVTHNCQLDVYERCTTNACPGLWGQEWTLYSVFDPMGDIPGESRIPLHPGCRCWYKADLGGWVRPAIIWSGVAIDALTD